jgi:hypothetical protein
MTVTTYPRRTGIRVETVNVKNDFGAVGDGVTDDTAAIQAALDYLLDTGRRGIAVLDPGTYRTTATIVVEGTSVSLCGEAGELATIIMADHTSGPAVRVKNRRSGLRNIEVSASVTRTAAAAGTNYGILIESDDTAGLRPSHGVYENLYVQDHPSHGVVVVGGCWFSEFSRMTIRDNGGHGLVFDNGAITSRTNRENPGITKLDRLEIFDNVGHGLIIGNDDSSSNRGFRFQLHNVDLYRNAESAGTRKTAAQMWAFMDTFNIEASAFDGRDQAQTASATHGITLYGRSGSVKNSRFLHVATKAMEVGGTIDGFNSKDIDIKGNYVFDNEGLSSSLDPAVTVHADAENINIEWDNRNEIVSIKPLDQNNVSQTKTWLIVKHSNQVVNNSDVAVNDTDLLFAMGQKQRVAFRFVVFFTGDAAADIKFQVVGPSGVVLTYAPSNGMRVSGGDTWSLQAATTSSGTFAVGTGGATPRMVEIAGVAKTTGTSGNLRLAWAQSAAVSADTTVLAESYLVVQG